MINATTKSHLDQVRNNKQSRTTHAQLNKKEADCNHTSKDIKTGYLYLACVHSHQRKNELLPNQLIQCPLQPRKKTSFLSIMIMIVTTSTQSHSNGEFSSVLHAYKTIHARQTRACLGPRLQYMDNKGSATLFFPTTTQSNSNLCLAGTKQTPQHTIYTLKNHLLAGLCTVNPSYPLHLWNKLLPQAVLTLDPHHQLQSLNWNLCYDTSHFFLSFALYVIFNSSLL